MSWIRMSAVLSALVASHAVNADFVVPDAPSYAWQRGVTQLSAYAEWDVFTAAEGPNAPDVGASFIGLTPPDAPAWDIFDSSGQSFLTSGGNIYSFAAPTNIHIVAPSFSLGDSYSTTVLLQLRTQGNEADHGSVRIGEHTPIERIELLRQPLGGLGGFLVETLYRFELDGSNASYEIRVDAAASSMSLDRVAVDMFATPVPPTCPADANGDLAVNGADLSVLLSQFGKGVENGDGADFNGDGTVNGADLSVLLARFGTNC